MTRLKGMDRLKEELGLIENVDLREFTHCGLLRAPTYWWTIESSKDHHCKDERKKGGRVLHAKRCAKIAYCMAEALYLDKFEYNLLISASLLHDMCVRGGEDECHTDKALYEHPLLVRVKLYGLILDYRHHHWMAPLLGLIETHMGRWGPRSPESELEKLFHMADLVASRDFVKVEV